MQELCSEFHSLEKKDRNTENTWEVLSISSKNDDSRLEHGSDGGSGEQWLHSEYVILKIKPTDCAKGLDRWCGDIENPRII